jgi:protein subunit release factor A
MENIGKMTKQLLFSVTAKDCRWDYYVGSGCGGQKRNKTANCVRCTHKASGAVGKSEKGRSQRQNKEKAFVHMVNTKQFKEWHRVEVMKRAGEMALIEQKVEKMMTEIRVEGKVDGKWESIR